MWKIVFLFSFLCVGCFFQSTTPNKESGFLYQRIEKKQFYFICGQRVLLEVAETHEQQKKGLMFRKSLKLNRGMIFIFPEEKLLTFWMKNVLFDLDIAFFDKNKKLINIERMLVESPLTQEAFFKTYSSKAQAQYAVELTAGFFDNVNTQDCLLSAL